MTRAIWATVFCAAIAPSVYAQAPIQPSEGPVVVTAGEAIVKRVPDRAWVQITAESRARNPREAQKLNSDAMSAVLQKLKGAGLPPDALQTRGYDLQPEYDYNNGRQTVRGYVARNTVEVRVEFVRLCIRPLADHLRLSRRLGIASLGEAILLADAAVLLPTKVFNESPEVVRLSPATDST